MERPVALIVLDGWGYRESTEHNAVAAADTPVFDKLWKKYPHALLEASGPAVGLPEGQMGNSEIGHTTIGAGKTIDTDLVRINKAAAGGEFVTNPVFAELFAHVRNHGSLLHVFGLVSDGGVHSHAEHLHAFLRAARDAGVTRVAIHAFTDGRDTAPRSAAQFLKELEEVVAEVGIAHIATVSGRYYGMDRDNNWDRLDKVEQAIFHGTTQPQNLQPSQVVEALYAQEKLDEHLKPMLFLDDSGKPAVLERHDAAFVFNFRSDRARMLTKRLQDRRAELDLMVATMTEYDPSFEVSVAFPPLSIETTLAAEISAAGLPQVHIAETEKYPHATYFLNGGRQTPHEGEQHVMLDSRKDVATHDLAPEMRAEGIADKAVEALENGCAFLFINFANPDMVGHTGNVEAIKVAVETVDRELGKVLAALEKVGGIAIVTADHGNAEQNVDPATGEMHTSHTLNLVPCILTDEALAVRPTGALSDLAPTALHLLGLPIPAPMTGTSLV